MDGWMDEWMDGCGQGGCQMGDGTDSYLVEQQMTSAEVVKQVMAVTVVTLLKVAMEIMWSAILLGVELSCEMIGIADQEGTMQHSDCMTIASVTVPEPKMRMLCFDDEMIKLKLNAAQYQKQLRVEVVFVVVKVKLESVPKDRTKLFEISMLAGIVLADSLEMNQVKKLTRAGQLCLVKEEKTLSSSPRYQDRSN